MSFLFTSRNTAAMIYYSNLIYTGSQFILLSSQPKIKCIVSNLKQMIMHLFCIIFRSFIFFCDKFWYHTEQLRSNLLELQQYVIVSKVQGLGIVFFYLKTLVWSCCFCFFLKKENQSKGQGIFLFLKKNSFNQHI